MPLIGISLIMMAFVPVAFGQRIEELRAAGEPTTGFAPLPVSFRADSSRLPEFPDSESYSWDFGDNSGSKGARTTHKFQNPGTYTVTVTRRRLVRRQPESYTELKRTLTITVLARPKLQVTPAGLDFQIAEGSNNPAPASLAVSNIGGGKFVWSVVSDSTKWLSLSPTNGTLPGGLGTVITAQAASAGLSAGDYAGTLTFSTRGDLGTSVTMTATLKVARNPPTPVTNSAMPQQDPPATPKFPWWILPAAITVGVGVILARKFFKVKTPQPVVPQVKLTMGKGVQQVKARGPLLSLFLRIRVQGDTGTEHVPAKTRLIGRITKLKGSKP